MWSSNEDGHRARLFWTVCIPLRLALATVSIVLGAMNEWTWLQVQAWIALAQLLGFAEAALRDPAVGLLGGTVWWKMPRLVHVAMYGVFVASALQRQWWAGLFLVLDVAVAIVAWVVVRPRRMVESGKTSNVTRPPPLPTLVFEKPAAEI